MRRVTAVAAVAVLLGFAPLGAVVADAPGDRAPRSAQEDSPCVGTVRDAPDRPTVVSIQGARGGDKTDAMLASFAPSGEVVGVHNDADYDRWWAYDVDRLDNGNFLLATTKSRHTLVEEVDPETGEHVTVRHFRDAHDTHDVDLINGDELVMNDMGDGHNRVFVYNLTREEVVWEYRFDEHTDVFPREGGGEYEEDWTHNNDVDQIEPGVFMVSVRNFDQVVAINRSTKAIEWTLGSDDDTDVLSEQHNPDYLETEDGRPTVVVADSLNDRVVEYTREGEEWNRTWVLRGGGLNEPRDADRLPNGNTLVADRRGDRVLEVTPEGEVLWEVYTPWQPYDVERLGTVDESSGPTMLDAGATGTHEMTGQAEYGPAVLEACYEHLRNHSSSRLVPADDPSLTNGTTQTADGLNGTATATATASPAEDGSVLGTTAAPDDDSSRVPTTAVGAVVAVAVVLGAVWWRRTE